MGVVGNGLEVSIHVANPLAGVALSLADDLLLGGGEASLFSETGLAGGTAFLVGTSGSFADESGIGVDLVKSLGVVEGVVLLGVVEDTIGLGSAEGGLDLVGVDDTSDVGIGDFAVGKGVALLLGGGLSPGSEDVVQLLEGTFSPDDKATNVASGGELEEVESADVGDFDTGDVSKGLDEGDIGSGVDDERSSAGSVASVSEFSLSGTDLDGVDDLLDITPGTGVSEESDGLLGAFDLFGGIADDEG